MSLVVVGKLWSERYVYIYIRSYWGLLILGLFSLVVGFLFYFSLVEVNIYIVFKEIKKLKVKEKVFKIVSFSGRLGVEWFKYFLGVCFTLGRCVIV